MSKKKAEAKAEKLTVKDYEKLGRELESLYQAGVPSRRVFYRTAFIKGILTGMGGVLGATVGIALLLWILSLFNTVPFIVPITESIRSTVETQQ